MRTKSMLATIILFLVLVGSFYYERPTMAIGSTQFSKIIEASPTPSANVIEGDIYTENSYVFIPIIFAGTSAIITPKPQIGIWISSEELAKLPTSGPAWKNLKEAADENAGTPDLSNQNDKTNVLILAKALVFARTGEAKYRDQVMEALQVLTYGNTESGGRALALGRELGAYVIAADLINLAEYNPSLDVQFRQKLRELLNKKIEGWGSDNRSLVDTHELRPNNWGTHAGASRAAIAVYLGDKAELERTAKVFHGYLGDLSAYNGFQFDDDLSWACDPNHPSGVNPMGCMKGGHSIDGALPEEMRRGGSFQWPPQQTGYPWEGLQGAVVQAEILYRAGYPTWQWENNALLRAVQFLYGLGWEPESDDRWQLWLINSAYGTSFPVSSPVNPGKNMGWTDWTHPGD